MTKTTYLLLNVQKQVIDGYGEKSLRRLRKSYILTKKIKLAIYKLLISIPKLISGNYRKKSTDND